MATVLRWGFRIAYVLGLTRVDVTAQGFTVTGAMTGLAIVKRAIEASGWSVTITGRGSNSSSGSGSDIDSGLADARSGARFESTGIERGGIGYPDTVASHQLGFRPGVGDGQ